jgi:hypothetical protein
MTPAKRELSSTERELIERWISAAESVRATSQNLSAFDALIAAQRARLVAPKGEKMPMMPQYILQGAAYALEQCGLLLRDANLLYRNDVHANAVVLTAFAREELGRSTRFVRWARRGLWENLFRELAGCGRSLGRAITPAATLENMYNPTDDPPIIYPRNVANIGR